MKNLYLLITLCLFSVGYGQNPADRDPSFNQFNLPLGNYFVENPISKSAILPDGKIMIVENNTKLLRLNGNLLDTSFDTGTGFNSRINDFVVQPDGKIIVIGSFTTYNGVSAIKIVRLNNDGSRDVTFNSGNTGFSYTTTDYGDAYEIVLQSDGKIIIEATSGGVNHQYNGFIYNNFFRLNANGTLDSSFIVDNNAFPNSLSAGKIFLQSDGKLLFERNGYYNSDPKQILRLNNNGSLDSSFNMCTANDNITKIICQADGKIIVGGQFTNFNSVSANRFLRLNSDGTIDSSFNVGTGVSAGGGTGSGDITNIAIQADGKILLTGEFPAYNNVSSSKFARINTNGSLDSTFNIGTGFYVAGTNDVSLFSDGKILVVGGFVYFNGVAVNNIVKLNTDGTRDSSFNNICAGFSLTNAGQIRATALQPDGKILVGGKFNAYNGITKSGLVRLNDDGSLDNTLGYTASTYDQFNDQAINTIAVQPDGKILLGGDFTSVNGLTRNRIVRMNSNGTLDNTFSIGTGFNYTVNKIVLLPNGKILVGGNFDTYKGVSCSGIVRLNANGSLDTSFLSGFVGNGGGNIHVMDVIVQPDGKTLINGYFNTTVNPTVSNLMRLNIDGTKDTTFIVTDPLVGRNAGLFLQQNGKILVGKSSFQNSTPTSLMRLNTDGSVDSSFVFDPATLNNFNTTVSLSYYPLLSGVQPDDKIFIWGYVSGYNFSGSIFRRLNSDGSIDNTFFTTPNSPVRVDVLSNGKLLAYNFGNKYRGTPARSIIRLLGQEYNFVQGLSKYDYNNNGCDINDLIFPNLKLNVTSGVNNQDYIADGSGSYNVSLPNGSHTLSPVFENPSYFNASPPNITVGFPVQSTPLGQNFCITPNGVHPDLEVVLLPVGIARPGFDAVYKLVYKNKGNQLQSGTVSLTFNDAVMDFVSAAPIASTQATNSRTWNFLNLKPFETREIIVTINLNSPTETPALNAGNVLNYTTAITSAQTDETPNDNTFVLNQTVVNSYDPNDKTCLQGLIVGTNKIGDYVHYVIRFENTGTYAAQNIIVKDLIDTNKFDINSLLPLNGSHLFTTKISEGNKVEFKFENINLPFAAGTNTGYVAFKIKTKSTLVAGDTFGGLANIYFDYNYPITTNTYITTIQALSVQDFSFENYFSLYPNPVSDVLNINSKESIEISSIHIYNVMGQLMMVIPNAKSTTSIDVSHLSSGNYFVKINSDKGTSNTKFIKR